MSHLNSAMNHDATGNSKLSVNTPRRSFAPPFRVNKPEQTIEPGDIEDFANRSGYVFQNQLLPELAGAAVSPSKLSKRFARYTVYASQVDTQHSEVCVLQEIEQLSPEIVSMIPGANALRREIQRCLVMSPVNNGHVFIAE